MFKSLVTLTSCNSENIFPISKILHALKSYDSETFISGVYFGGEARHEVHRTPNARLANEQKRNRQILHVFSFSIDLGSELDSEGYPKMSDDKNL